MQWNAEEDAATPFRETPLHSIPTGQTPPAAPLALLRERARPWLVPLYLLFVAAVSIRTGALQARADNPWSIGDWLINYSGGFVRRGLTGALILLLHRATAAPLAWVAFSLQTTVFLLFLACVYLLLQRIRWSWLIAAVLLSPATLSYTVLDSTSGFRKEILVFAALSLILCVLDWGRLRDWQ